MAKKIHYPHPGELLKEDLDDLEITQYRLAKDLGIPHSRVTAIIKGRQGITATTALKLARYFRTSPEYWMNMQREYDIRRAKAECADELKQIKPIAA